MDEQIVTESPAKGAHLLTTREATMMLFGAYEKLQRYRLYSMIENGDVRAHKLGRRWYVNKKDCLHLAGLDSL